MKIEKKLWIGFFMNLLGVVLGILLTFGVNSLYQKHEEKKKTKEILILVRNELQANKTWFTNQENSMRRDVSAYKKILKAEAENSWKSIPEDTLKAYFFQTQSLEFAQLTTSAWQIFQNADIIQKMTDKELIIRLTDCYYWIGKIQDLIQTQYWNNKMSAIVPEVDTHKYFDALMNKKEAVFFYTKMSSEDFDIWNIFPFIDAIIDYTIVLLDNHGDYKYDMTEKDAEINSYIESRVDSVSMKNDTTDRK